MSESLFMLDTNMASYAIRNRNEKLDSQLVRVGVTNLCISAITEAELRFGLWQNPSAIKLKALVNEFFARVDTLPWGTDAARSYAELRTHSKAKGFTLNNMDMLIGAHSIAIGATLVTNDNAFTHLSDWVDLENWIHN